MARTQDVGVGLGPAKPGSDAAEVEPLGGRARSRRGYLLSRACSEAGVGRGGKLTKHNALGGVHPSSKGGPRSATTSRLCMGGGGRTVVVGGTRSEVCGSDASTQTVGAGARWMLTTDAHLNQPIRSRITVCPPRPKHISASISPIYYCIILRMMREC